MNKWIFSTFFFINLFITTPSHAESFGLGAMIGDPTGISAKMWLDQTHAIDGAFAWSLSGPNALHIHSDYLFHRLNLFYVGPLPINLFYGIGARVSNYTGDNKSGLGLAARAPVGLTYQFRDPRVEIFAEVAALLELVPDTDLFFNLGIGGRFYF